MTTDPHRIEMLSSDVRTRFREVLAHVAAGKEVVVIHYNRPVALITRYQEEAMKVLTATLTKNDAWGKPRTVTVEWMPLDITEIVNPAWLNKPSLGRLLAHGADDDAPVFLERTNEGGVALRHVVRSHQGERAHVTEFSRIETREQLVPGTYFIADDSAA